MPPQINFSAEHILAVAFELVRQEGIERLSARRIAQRLHCSTHPIYRAFQSMKDLETAVIQQAREYAVQYMLQEGETDIPFLNIGLRYFRFAQEEKALFKLLYMSGKVPIDIEQTPPPFGLLLERMQQDPTLQTLEEERLKRILKNLWIFTHGLTTLACVDSLEEPPDTIYDDLRQMGRTIIQWEHLSQQGMTDEHICQEGQDSDNRNN